jgi:hypothetical protein
MTSVQPALRTFQQTLKAVHKAGTISILLTTSGGCSCHVSSGVSCSCVSIFSLHPPFINFLHFLPRPHNFAFHLGSTEVRQTASRGGHQSNLRSASSSIYVIGIHRRHRGRHHVISPLTTAPTVGLSQNNTAAIGGRHVLSEQCACDTWWQLHSNLVASIGLCMSVLCHTYSTTSDVTARRRVAIYSRAIPRPVACSRSFTLRGNQEMISPTKVMLCCMTCSILNCFLGLT